MDNSKKHFAVLIGERCRVFFTQSRSYLTEPTSLISLLSFFFYCYLLESQVLCVFNYIRRYLVINDFSKP